MQNKPLNIDINVPFTVHESLTSIGHKRKASQEIDPSFEYANHYGMGSPENKGGYVMDDEKKMHHRRLLLDLNKEANSLENETEVESHTTNIEVGSREKAENVKGMPHRGFMFDLNKKAEEDDEEVINASTSNKVKTSLSEKIVLDFDLNETLPNEDE